MENNESKKVCIRNRLCYYFDDKIKLEDLDFDIVLTDEKSHRNILIYDVQNFDWHKTFMYYVQ